LRVGIDVTPLIGRRTGIGRFTEGLVDGLAASSASTGIDVVPFAMTARGRHDVAPRQRFPMPARAVRRVWEHSNHPRLERWTGRLDVAHGTNYVVPPTAAARLVSVHDLTALRYPEMCTPDVRRMPILLRRAIDNGAHVHTDSRFVADEVIDLLVAKPEHVHVIAPGVPFDAERLRHAQAAGPLMEGRPFVLALGTLEPRKALPSLVRAFAEVSRRASDVCLVIAGADGWGVEDLNATLASLSSEVRARVIRMRDVDDDLRDRLLVQCAVFVYPSLYEGFGFPPLEAMLAGRPVVSTTAGSLPEVLGDAATLVGPNDSEALADVILRVLTDSTYAADLADRGLKQASVYTWKAMTAQFVDLYRELAAR
jgi:glycosyltransferase involved in cell wall biosynthesis